MSCAWNAIAYFLLVLSNLSVCSSLVTVSFTELVSGDDGLYKQREEGYGESGSGKLDGEVIDDHSDTESKPPPTLIVICCLCFVGFLIVLVSFGILISCCCKRRCWMCGFMNSDATSNSPEPSPQ